MQPVHAPAAPVRWPLVAGVIEVRWLLAGGLVVCLGIVALSLRVRYWPSAAIAALAGVYGSYLLWRSRT